MYFWYFLEAVKIKEIMTSKGLDQKKKPSKSPKLNGDLQLLMDMCIQRSSKSLNQRVKKTIKTIEKYVTKNITPKNKTLYSGGLY